MRRDRFSHPTALALVDDPGLRSHAAVMPNDLCAVGQAPGPTQQLPNVFVDDHVMILHVLKAFAPTRFPQASEHGTKRLSSGPPPS